MDYPFPEAPAAGELKQVRPGVYWLRMPLPFALNHINLWLLEDGDGWTLVDTGICVEDVKNLWRRLLEVLQVFLLGSWASMVLRLICKFLRLRQKVEPRLYQHHESRL